MYVHLRPMAKFTRVTQWKIPLETYLVHLNPFQEKSRSAILENSVSDLNSKLTQTLAELTECEESVVKLKTVAEAHEAELSKV